MAEDFTGCCYIFPWHLHLADEDPEEEKEEEATIRPSTMMQPIATSLVDEVGCALTRLLRLSILGGTW